MKAKAVLAILVIVLFAALVDKPKPTIQTRTVAAQQPAAWTPPSYTPAPKLPTRPCAEDDSVSRNCYWDAAKRGNGKGHSYFVDARGHVTYLNPALNSEAKRRAFAASKERAGWEFWGVVFGHQLCWAKVGDTSYIHCFDGFRETS